MSKIDIHKLIDDAMEKKDRYVSLYIGPQGDISVTIHPMIEELSEASQEEV